MNDVLGAMDDTPLQDALRALGGALDVGTPAPPGAPDLATRVRVRIVAEGVVPATRPWWERIGAIGAGRGRRGRRSLVLATVLVVAVAATAGAIGLGVPGIRIILGPGPTAEPGPTTVASAPPSPAGSPTASPPPGVSLGLGQFVPPADIERLTGPEALGFTAVRPDDPAIGPPDASYLLAGRLSMVWAPGPTLPATETPSVGLVLTQFRGSIDPGFFNKLAGPGTTVDRVGVGDSPGYWVAGELHLFFYTDHRGQVVEETRRFVGDTLIWTVGDITYRLEIATGLERALEIATSLP